MEKKEKKIKEPKAPKEKKTKKSKMPEGYIGRPKPMKVKKQIFHKPTVANWIEIGIFAVVAVFITVIVFKLIDISKVVDPDFEYYEISDSTLDKEFKLESNDLVFELDPATTQFTVTNKKTGKIWYSSPENAMSDPLALPKEKNNMMSAFLLKYSTINGNDDVYDIYTKSIKNKFYDVEKKGNEILVHYTIGDIEREYYFPLAIYENELLEWEEGLSKSKARIINNAYHKYTVDNFKGEELDSMLTKYPNMEEEPIYLVFDNLQKYVKEQIEDLFKSQGYTLEDYERHKEMYKESNIKTVPSFNVTVSYKIEGDSFIVEVPFDEISYKHTYPIVQLSVLPYFGAGSKDDEGFIFVPEGGGNIINFNNGKTKQNAYYADIYGWDLATDRKYINVETRSAYPVYGISNNGESYICIMEDASSYAGISADISGRLGSYNYVRADYRMLHRELYDISSRSLSTQYSYEAQLPAGEKIRQVYKFQDTGDYVNMANAYRDYLFKGEKKLSNKSTALAVDILGAIDKAQQIGGVPKTMPYMLTSYKDAEKIISSINNLGFEDVNIRLTGFINEGVHQTFMNKVRYIKELGGKGDFNKLVKAIKNSASKIYLEGTVQTAFRSTFFGEGFNKYKHAARFASDALCEIDQFSPLWYGPLTALDSYFLLKPKYIEKNTNTFVKAVDKKGLNVAFSDLGYLLSSDLDEDYLVSRETVKAQHIKLLENATADNKSLMIRYGNDYAIKYADFITDVDLAGNSYALFDEKVPFYQIALHGYKNYSGPAINLADDTETAILDSARTGASLYFVFTEESTDRIQETNFTEYYATCYDILKDDFVSIYKTYNDKLGKVSNSCIVDYEQITDNVTKTTYDNGYAVYVNYGYSDYVTTSGTKVASRDYILAKVEE